MDSGTTVVRWRSCVDLFKGRFIVLSIRTVSLKHAKWIGRLWCKQNSEGRFKYTARLVPDLSAYLHGIAIRFNEYPRLAKRIRLGKYTPSQYAEWMQCITFERDGETVRRLWLETSHEVILLAGLWQRRSSRNSCRAFQLRNGQLKQVVLEPSSIASAER